MNKENVLKVLNEIKTSSPKRKFTQTIDLIINLKDLDMKKTEQQIDFFGSVHFRRHKEVKVCALVGPELLEHAKEVCDFTIPNEEFSEYAKNKTKTKKLAENYDFFIAQANIMPQVASAFGKILGTRGKMPNPKAGCVVPPKTNLKPLYQKLKLTVRVSAKKDPTIKIPVGKEDQPEAEVVDNVIAILDQLIHHIPGGKNNIRNAMLKLTMGKPIRIEV